VGLSGVLSAVKISLLEQDEFRWLPRWHVAYTRNADIATIPVCQTTGIYRDGGEFGARVDEVEGWEKWCPDCFDWLRLRKGKALRYL
jgi:hypothetical protein